MPKAPTGREGGTSKPYTNHNNTKLDRSSETTSRVEPDNDPAATSQKTIVKSKTKDPKASHLYTDDNPSTTLHGTGFKDAATAEHTLNIISGRSLLYQFQTVNTMFHRAKHHPHSDNNKNIQAAMLIFDNWLHETYPSEKLLRPDYKPILKRETVERFLDKIRAAKGIDENWAEMYVNLPKGKRLGNVLMDNSKPEGPDMVVERDEALKKLTGGRLDSFEEDLWDEEGKVISLWHLKCVAFAWSPVSEARLRQLT